MAKTTTHADYTATALTLTTAAQPNITSVGTLTSFRSTGIDDNADALAITIDSSERVGIGQTSPTTPLHVESSTSNQNTTLIKNTAGTGVNYGLEIQAGTNATDHALQVLDSGGTSRFRVTGEGNVGVGETSPLGKLHIKGTDTGASASAAGNSLVLEDTENGLSILSSTAGAGYINFGDSDDNDIGMIIYDHSANAMRFWTNAAERVTINSDGYTTLSRAGGDYGLQIRSSSNRSGLVIDKPGTSTIMGSALVVGADERFKLGTASYYHVEMKQNGDTKINNHLLLTDSFGYRAYSGYFSGGTSTGTFDFNTYGAGVYEVTAAFGHYGYITGYGCFKKAICSNGAGYSTSTSINVTDIATEISTTNGGSWSFGGFSSGSHTTSHIRVTKNAGSYSGGGYYFVEVRGNQSS
jgi:hypothetical protein